MRDRKPAPLLVALLLGAAVSTCSKSNVLSPSGPEGLAPRLTAPALETPSDDQLTTRRPTLTVRNGSSNQAGPRTYEFQLADNTGFSPVAVTRTGIEEDASGRTSITLGNDLQPSTRFYWRARITQRTTSSEWSPTGRFRTRALGFNRPGELYDPLTDGATLGTPVGTTNFVPDKGLRIETENSYVRYELPQTVASGEFSVEVEGLRPNGPGQKLKVFSMMDGPGDLIASRYQVSVMYRGVNGNPDNCIAFKAVWGDLNVKLETDLGQRSAAVMFLDPSKTYLWQANWTSTAFRLLVRDGGVGGNIIYDRTINAPSGTGPYAPTPHYAYLGANSGAFGTETGSWPGVIYRNVWLGEQPRPASLGSAFRPER